MKKLLSLMLSLALIFSVFSLPIDAYSNEIINVSEVEILGIAPKDGAYIGAVKSHKLKTPEDAPYAVVSPQTAYWKDENGIEIDPLAQMKFESGRTYTVSFNVEIKYSSRGKYRFTKNTTAVCSYVEPEFYTGKNLDVVDNGNYVEVEFTITVEGERTYPDIDCLILKGPDASSLHEGAYYPYQRRNSFGLYYNNCTVKDESWSGYNQFVAGETYTYTCTYKANANYKFASNPVVSMLNCDVMKLQNQTVSKDRTELTLTYEYSVKGITKIDTVYINAPYDYNAFAPSPGVSTNDKIYSQFDILADSDAPYIESLVLSDYTPFITWYDSQTDKSIDKETFVEGKSYYFTVQYQIKDEYLNTHVFSDEVDAVILGEGYDSNYSVETYSPYGGKTIRLKYTFVSKKPNTVDSADIYINSPVDKQMPSFTELYNVPEYCYTVVAWYKNGVAMNPYGEEPFEAGASYKVEIDFYIYSKYKNRLTATPNLKTAKINGNNATVSAPEGHTYNDGFTLTYNFGKCPAVINNVALTVNAPVEGQTVSYNAVTESNAYAIKGDIGSTRSDYMKWFVSNDGINYTEMKSSDKFAAGKYYKLYIDVYTKGNYIFAIDSSGATLQPGISASVNGFEASVIKAYDQNPDEWVTVIYDFGICNDSIIEEIKIINVEEPVAGELPSYTYNVLGSGYSMNTSKNAYYDDWQHNRKLYYIKNGIGWYDLTKNDWVYENEAFIGGHDYQACVYLTANDGFTFWHDKNYQMLFTATINTKAAQGNTTTSQGLVEQRITASFPCAAKEISHISINCLDAPKVGNTPDYAVELGDSDYYELANYGINGSGIIWYDSEDNMLSESDTFEEGKQYKVEIKIVPKEYNAVASSRFINPVSASVNGNTVSGDNNQVLATEKVAYIYYTFPGTAAQADSYTVYFEANGGSGIMLSRKVQGGAFTLPECTFTAPNEKQFKTWAVNSANGTACNAGSSYNVNSNTVFYAVWEASDHVHNYSKLKFNGDYHWYECTCGGKVSFEEHIFDNDFDASCNVCSFTRTISHTHSYTIKKHDANNHWNECICGEKQDIKAHNFTTYSSPCFVSDKTEGYYYKKCSCGYQKSNKTYYCPKTYTLSKTSYTYGNGEKKPSVTIKDTKGNTLKSGTDYTVSYTANKNVGTATAKIKFKGNYVGDKKMTFKINPKGTKIKKVTAPAKKQLKVSWNIQSDQITGYEIWIATDKSFSKNLKKIKVPKKSATYEYVNNLKKNTKYFVKIRTYKTINKSNYCSKWSDVVKQKTK